MAAGCWQAEGRQDRNRIRAAMISNTAPQVKKRGWRSRTEGEDLGGEKRADVLVYPVGKMYWMDVCGRKNLSAVSSELAERSKSSMALQCRGGRGVERERERREMETKRISEVVVRLSSLSAALFWLHRCIGLLLLHVIA